MSAFTRVLDALWRASRRMGGLWFETHHYAMLLTMRLR